MQSKNSLGWKVETAYWSFVGLFVGGVVAMFVGLSSALDHETPATGEDGIEEYEGDGEEGEGDEVEETEE